MPESPFRPRTATDRLILGVDVPTVAEAEKLVMATEGAVGVYKIGMELQFAGGLEFARDLAADGKNVFLDVKLLDIDNTIYKAVQNVARMGVKFMTLHAYPKAMRAAIKAVKEVDADHLCLLGVTVLTSMDEADLADAGYRGRVAELVARRGADARAAGMGGIVCSPQESETIRKIVGEELVMITPGIRPPGSDAGDQKRIMTPGDAVKAGSDYLVVGRPINQASNPRQAALDIVAEIEAADSQTA